MTTFKIWSRGIDKSTNEVISYRSEYIDTAKNSLFKSSDNKLAVKNKYEAFWNISPRLVEERVAVDKVKLITKPPKHAGGNWGIKVRKVD